jgi:hypothetical protein
MDLRQLSRPGRDRDETPLQRAADGAVAGLVATVVMTAYRMPISHSLPPTAEFLARYAGGDPEDHTVSAVLLHLGYGAAAGSAFGLLFRASGWGRTADPEREGAGVVLGALYGGVLSAVGTRLILDRLLSMDLDANEALVFHVSHVVFGLSLGSWVSSQFVAGPDPD